jgi:beta-xylosidase
MTWQDDWPVMGADHDGNGVGEPVATAPLPAVAVDGPTLAPQTSDAFDDAELGLQWQWQGNPKGDWASLDARRGWLRLNGVEPLPGGLIATPNQLLQKLPAPSFTATTAVEFAGDSDDDRAGLVVTGQTCFALLVSPAGGELRISQLIGDESGAERIVDTVDASAGHLWLRVTIEPGARCTFSYSSDGEAFTPIGEPQPALAAKWTGAKVGVVCQGLGARADFDEFVIE